MEVAIPHTGLRDRGVRSPPSLEHRDGLISSLACSAPAPWTTGPHWGIPCPRGGPLQGGINHQDGQWTGLGPRVQLRGRDSAEVTSPMSGNPRFCRDPWDPDQTPTLSRSPGAPKKAWGPPQAAFCPPALSSVTFHPDVELSQVNLQGPLDEPHVLQSPTQGGSPPSPGLGEVGGGGMQILPARGPGAERDASSGSSAPPPAPHRLPSAAPTAHPPRCTPAGCGPAPAGSLGRRGWAGTWRRLSACWRHRPAGGTGDSNPRRVPPPAEAARACWWTPSVPRLRAPGLPDMLTPTSGHTALRYWASGPGSP